MDRGRLNNLRRLAEFQGGFTTIASSTILELVDLAEFALRHQPAYHPPLSRETAMAEGEGTGVDLNDIPTEQDPQ